MRVLVIASHPDDEILGCGGTMARLAAEGHDISVAILGEGWTSRSAKREDADPGMPKRLSTASEHAAALLGARCVHHGGLPDNRFDTVPLLDVVKMIEQVIADVRPESVYTQHGGDLNIDHVVTYRATLTASRPMDGGSIRSVYAYEVASSSEWAFQQFSPVFRPNLFVDISGTLERKLQALEYYESETRAFPHPRSAEALRANALRWGSVVGVGAAEAFQLVREIR